VGGYEYVIVGGGTAGCVLAARLSENPDVGVLLLEAGAAQGLEDTVNFLAMWGSPVDWAFRTTPQAGLDGVVLPAPRGKVLGGSSTINAMIHIRGHRTSYDAWEKGGATGWNFDTLLPYFKRSEQATGDPRWRGVDGPMKPAPAQAAEPGSFYYASFEAALQSGVPRTEDGNGEHAEGVSRPELAMVDFVRQSAADAFLAPAMARSNLTVVTGAVVQRLVLSGGRCIGVEYVLDGQVHVVGADREVVLAAGAVGSPQLLMVSGVGPAGHLRGVGVEVVEDLPGVGENLQDHPLAHMSFRSPEFLDDGKSPSQPLMVLRSDPAADPDLQLAITHLPLPARVPGEEFEPWGSSQWTLKDANGYSVIFCLMRPESRGTVRLAGSDVLTAPLIDPGYYTDPRDLDKMVVALRTARELGNQDALAPFRVEELNPGAEVTGDKELREYVKLATGPFFHLTGTCAIGTDDRAVVDPDLRVYGIEGLRVADASVMPSVVAANTNATVLAIAERAADILISSASR
jgi:choline dehydrogenase